MHSDSVSSRMYCMNTVDPLAFETPLEENTAKWDAAEKQALRFPEKLIEKSRELHEAVQGWSRDRDELDRIRGLVVRNLIILASNCKTALSEIAPEQAAIAPADTMAPSGSPAASPETMAEPTPPFQAAGRSIEAIALGGVARMIASLLADLGVYRVELLGRTYQNVEFNGQKVDDPFEVLEAQQRGKASEIKVREVVSDLWVSRQGDYVKVLQRGKVIC